MASLMKSGKAILENLGNILSRSYTRRNVSLICPGLGHGLIRKYDLVRTSCLFFPRATILSPELFLNDSSLLSLQKRWASRSPSLSMTKLSKKELSQIVRDVMKEWGMPNLEMPNENSLQEVRGFAKFICSNPSCPRDWFSRFAYADINWEQQKVTKLYKQKCNKCGTKNEPYFSRGNFKRIVQNAIEKFYRNLSNSGSPDDEIVQGGLSHKSKLCEKCGYGKTRCWTHKYKKEK
ncbi:uncharacterized protein LOC135153743 isoform X2 [Lytechinus pictus]|uniref:uncharacterized protein LOC135153743 isoform X2 n=1 Tax=Lytechinus pictus TaxID=7653 RepID=UPI0030BA212E